MTIVQLSSNYYKTHAFSIRVVCIFILFFLYMPYTNAQTWQWAKNYGGNGFGGPEQTTTDPFGNIYMVGTFTTDTIIFGSTILTRGGMFIAKFDNNGNVLWAKNAPATGYSGDWHSNTTTGYSTTTDASGNVYVAGTYDCETITFGSTTFTNAGGNDFFIVKYDASGNLLWAKTAGGPGDDETFSMTKDNMGHIYIYGYFNSPSLTLSSNTLNSMGQNIFLVKYDSLGNVIWARDASGDSISALSQAITTDALGNLYITGSFNYPTIVFGADTLFNNTPTGSEPNMFLVKYDSTGNVLWGKNGGGNGIYAMGIYEAVDVDGNIYTTGIFSGDMITFGDTTFNNPGTYIDIFIVKYDNSGNVVWTRVIDAPGDGDNECRSIATDITGNVYLTGFSNGPTLIFNSTVIINPSTEGNTSMFLAKYSNTGNVEWVTNAGGDNNNVDCLVMTDSLCNVYVSGGFTGNTLSLGNSMLINNHSSSSGGIFLAKLDSANATAMATQTLTPDQKNITLYPNPNNGQMTVNLNAAGYTSLQVYDCLGSKVYTTLLTGTEKTTAMDMRTMPPGVYYLHAVSSSNSVSIPFVIMAYQKQ